MEKSADKIWRAASGKSPFQRRNQQARENYWKGLLESLRDKLPRSNDYETFVFGIVDELVWLFVSICSFEAPQRKNSGKKVSKLG